MMNKLLCCLMALLITSPLYAAKDSSTYSAFDKRIQYTGRIQWSNPQGPVMWAPGAYMDIAFEGSYCILEITDEHRYGIHHNFLVIQVDDEEPTRIALKEKHNRIVLAQHLTPGKHRIKICKATEAEIGYVQPTAIITPKLKRLPKKPKRKIEFIGDSITAGMGNDSSATPCGKGGWYLQHNAWLAYGPRTARALKAQWHLSAISGIGLVHSCCNKSTVMPPLYKKLSLSADSLDWDFKQYQPAVISICLGENDGIQDSATFCNAYIQFLKQIRAVNPQATLILLSSPMSGGAKKAFQQKMLQAVYKAVLPSDKKIGYYIFSKQYNAGCTYHPSAEEHAQIAEELTRYLRKRIKW